MYKPIIALILAAGAIGLVAAATITALRAEVDALRQELHTNIAGVNALQAETGRLAAAVAAASAEPVKEVPPAESRERPRSGRDLDSPERAAWVAARSAMLATTAANFQAETRNVAWSSEKTSTLRETVAGLGALGGALRALDCRSKTCRVQLSDDDATSSELHRFVRACGRVFPKIVADHVAEPQGKASYVLYLMTDAA